MADIKHMDIAEFVSEGYLQEANRRFFHPLGLALEVMVEEDGSTRISGVWDERDDPEGVFFDGEHDAEKCLHILDLQNQRRDARQQALGFWIEPIPRG